MAGRTSSSTHHEPKLRLSEAEIARMELGRLPQGLVVHAFVHARPTTTWTEPDRTALSGRWPQACIRRSEPF